MCRYRSKSVTIFKMMAQDNVYCLHGNGCVEGQLPFPSNSKKIHVYQVFFIKNIKIKNINTKTDINYET